MRLASLQSVGSAVDWMVTLLRLPDGLMLIPSVLYAMDLLAMLCWMWAETAKETRRCRLSRAPGYLAAALATMPTRR